MRSSPSSSSSRIAGEQEREHVADAAVVGERPQARDLEPALALGGDVETEIGEEVTAGYGVAGVPGIADAVGRRGPAAGHDGVLRIHAGENDVLDAGAAEDGADDGVLGGVLLGLDRGGLEQPGHHGGEHLHVADLLGADVEDHVLVLGRGAAVPALEQVGHHHGHLAPLAADDLLELPGEDRIGLVGLGVILEGLGVSEHR